MKKFMHLLNSRSALLLIAAVCFAGCKTPSQNQQLASAVKMAAYIGTSEYLLAHPEAKPKFEQAEQELFALAGAEKIDAITLLAIAQRLPLKQLKSERAAIYITAATLLLSDYGESIPAEQIKDLQPIAKAMGEGIGLGLGSK
jgi:hypothetical protein